MISTANVLGSYCGLLFRSYLPNTMAPFPGLFSGPSVRANPLSYGLPRRIKSRKQRSLPNIAPDQRLSYQQLSNTGKRKLEVMSLSEQIRKFRKVCMSINWSFTAELVTGDVPRSASHQHFDSQDHLKPNFQHLANLWTLERVTVWLRLNGFSIQWREVFKELNIQGHDFLDIASSTHERKKRDTMHHQIFPVLAKRYELNGMLWDYNREYEEGLRIFGLVRNMVESPPTEEGNLRPGGEL